MIRLKQFSYFKPTSIKEAAEILAEKGKTAYPLAGGTDLLVRMKRGNITPAVIVNLKRIKGLDEIKNANGNGIHVGALVSISAIEDSPLIKTSYPVLSQAAGVLGGRSIRNLATIGGNIGRASPASDMAPALMVLQARVEATGLSGTKEIQLDDIFAGPGVTSLSAGEIITAFILPKTATNSGAAYIKLGRRGGGGDCALVGLAAFMSMEDDHATAVRIAMSSVGPKPLRALQAEEVVLSGTLNEARMREAAETAAEEAAPITDMRCSASYRKEMVKVLTFRALQQAQQKAQGGMVK
jgi:carbon-monoxide dehydrogenase medium subunit